VNILLAVDDLYEYIGGGQIFFRGLIERHTHSYYYFSHTTTPLNTPVNAHAVAMTHIYRDRAPLCDFSLVSEQSYSIKGKEYDFMRIMDLMRFRSLMKMVEFRMWI